MIKYATAIRTGTASTEATYLCPEYIGVEDGEMLRAQRDDLRARGAMANR